MQLPGLAEIESAAELVYQSMQASPQLSWPLLNERLGCEAWIKHENQNPTGAFKVRGGLIYLNRLVEKQPGIRGICAATRGNHGQSAAFAAALRDMVGPWVEDGHLTLFTEGRVAWGTPLVGRRE